MWILTSSILTAGCVLLVQSGNLRECREFNKLATETESLLNEFSKNNCLGKKKWGCPTFVGLFN